MIRPIFSARNSSDRTDEGYHFELPRGGAFAHVLQPLGNTRQRPVGIGIAHSGDDRQQPVICRAVRAQSSTVAGKSLSRTWRQAARFSRSTVQGCPVRLPRSRVRSSQAIPGRWRRTRGSQVSAEASSFWEEVSSRAELSLRNTKLIQRDDGHVTKLLLCGSVNSRTSKERSFLWVN